MTPERLERVKEVLSGALECPTADRSAWVASACAGDLAMEEEVLSLLAQAQVPIPQLEQPLFLLQPMTLGTEDLVGEPQPAAPEMLAGQRIGSYQIVRPLGEGGMGTVVLATRQDDFHKQVAIKLIKRSMVSPEVLDRFHNERQILAHLEHPNIATIFDGGAENGIPYFVMEYIDGKPLDVFCDEHKLSIRQRLEIFLQICSALQAAHQSLVVHRDLKPANILVTQQGVPKLLDFGIAKRLIPEPEFELTRQARHPMTLKYASPEQIENRQITTASDIYSLGVVLYELLSGHSPYHLDSSSDLALLRAICEEVPKKPSTRVRQTAATPTELARAQTLSQSRDEGDPHRLQRRLAGDLDSIVLKALQKNPQQRYSSVEQLAQDVRRHLAGLPVLARDGTALYRLGKFVSRHRGRLGLGLAAALILAVGLTLGLKTKIQADRAQNRAEALSAFVDKLLGPDDLNPELKVRELLANASKDIRKNLAGDPESLANMLEALGLTYSKIGLYPEAEELLVDSVAQKRQLFGPSALLARALNNLAGVYFRASDYEKAEPLYRESLEMRRELGQEGTDLVPTQLNLAAIWVSWGRFAEAEATYLKALKLRRAEHGPDSPEAAKALRSLGNLYYLQGNFPRAQEVLLDCLRIEQQASKPDRKRLALVLSSLGRVRLEQQQFAEARQNFEEALRLRVHELGEDHPDVAATKKDLAALALATSDLATASTLLDQALLTLRLTKDPGSWEIAEGESLLGELLTQQGRYAEAEPLLKSSYEVIRKIRGEQAIYTRLARARLVKLYVDWGKPEEAAKVSATGPT